MLVDIQQYYWDNSGVERAISRASFYGASWSYVTSECSVKMAGPFSITQKDGRFCSAHAVESSLQQ